MNNSTCHVPNVPQGMTKPEKERVMRANQAYCSACEENGIKVCSWESFPTWREYVDGKIDESQLQERATSELKEFKQTFSKYTVISPQEEAGVAKEEAIKKDRAKLANRIYKQLCTESGLSYCFFKNFGTWSDYVNGNIGDLEFMEKVRMETQKLVAEAS